MSMKERIIKNIGTMIGYLELIREEVEKGDPESVDSLDMLSLVSIGLEATYREIKEHFKMMEEE